MAKMLGDLGFTPADVEERTKIYKTSVDWTFTLQSLMKYWTEIPGWVDDPPQGREKEYALSKGLAAKALGR
jgi:hypothetical protein